MNASMAFLSKIIRDGKMKTDPVTENEESETKGEVLHINIEIRNDIYENWLKCSGSPLSWLSKEKK